MLTAERAAATIFAVLKIGRSNENGYSIVLPSLSIEFGARCAFDNGPMGIKGIQATFFRAPKVGSKTSSGGSVIAQRTRCSPSIM
jgi:hypothetical protein